MEEKDPTDLNILKVAELHRYNINNRFIGKTR